MPAYNGNATDTLIRNLTEKHFRLSLSCYEKEPYIRTILTGDGDGDF